MANNIIEIYVESNIHLVSPGQIVTLGEGANFDTVTKRFYFGSGVPSAYDAGGSAEPGPKGTWICIGTSDVEVLPGGPTVATVTWRGLSTAHAALWTGTETYATRETTYDLIAGIPGTPNLATEYKGRLIDIIPGYSFREIVIGARPARPKPQSGAGTFPTPQGAPTINTSEQIAVFGAATTYVYPNGWIPVSWQAEEILPGIHFVSAEYRFEFDKVFG